MSTLRRSARVASRPIKQTEPEEQGPVIKKARTSKSEVTTTTSAGLEIGDKIPDIKLLNQDSEEIDLAAAAKSSKYVVIFAYPRANSGNVKGGCTYQLIGFEKNYAFFKENNTTVFGLSADSPKSQKSFHDKHNAEFDLLSDPQRKLISILGAKKSPLGIKRSYWLFVDGILKIKEIQVSPQVSFDGAKAEIEKLNQEGKNGIEVPKYDVETKKEENGVTKTEEENNEEESKDEDVKQEETKAEVKDETKDEDKNDAKEESKEKAKEETIA